jgi:hypothetical protein
MPRFAARLFAVQGTLPLTLLQLTRPAAAGGRSWEIAYVPSGKPDSDFPSWFNPRLSLQYTTYSAFDGTSAHASDNNTLYPLLWIAG